MGYDHLPEQTWRHLDTMQFGAIEHCRLPRVRCAVYGVKTLKAPWGNGRGFTLAFEAFAIWFLQAVGSTEQARKCLRLSWRQAQRMMRRAVEAGLARRTLETSDVRAVGLDEKSFLRGNRYATILYSHDMKCVFEVVEGRSSAAGKAVLQRAIPEALRGEVKAVSMVFRRLTQKPYARSWQTRTSSPTDFTLPNASVRPSIKFGITNCPPSLSPAVMYSKTTRFLWLKDCCHLCETEIARHDALIRSDLKTATAWHLREAFKHFFQCATRQATSHYFSVWLSWVHQSSLPPMKRLARTLLSHLQPLLNYIHCGYLTNARAEGFNSKIQTIKTSARGFATSTISALPFFFTVVVSLLAHSNCRRTQLRINA